MALLLDFDKIFEYVTVPLSIGEADQPNKLVYANKAYCDLTGYSIEELLGINPGKLLQRDMPTSNRDYIRRQMNTLQPIDVLVKNFRKDGSEFWNGLHIHPVIENGRCIYWVGMAKDVSEFVTDVNSGLENVISVVKDNLHQMKQDLADV